jgi:hypothetical protein
LQHAPKVLRQRGESVDLRSEWGNTPPWQDMNRDVISHLNSRSSTDVELLYLCCKEGWQRSVLSEYHLQKQALSRFFIGAILQIDPVLDVIRRELRRISPDVRIDTDQIRDVLTAEVIKREVMEGEKAIEAKKKIARITSKNNRARKNVKEGEKGERESELAPAELEGVQ